MIKKEKAKRKILFYCGWGGLGHIARAYSIISELPPDCSSTVVSAENWVFPNPSKNFSFIKLPTPKSRICISNNKKTTLQNYVLGANDIIGYQKHLHFFLSSLEKIKPDIVVVDNPAEISLLSKLLGYKTAVMYESLKTKDLRWRLAWNSVDFILAPYPKKFLEKANFPYIKKTYCSGGFTRYDAVKKYNKKEARKKLNLSENKKYILLTVGKGRMSEDIIEKICSSTKKTEYKVLLLYPIKNDVFLEKIRKLPHVMVFTNIYNEINLFLSSADFVITGGGYSSLMESFLFRKPTIAIPFERIYKEQETKTEIFSKMGALISINKKNINEEKIKKAIKKISNKKVITKMTSEQNKIVRKSGAKNMANFIVSSIK